MKDKYLLWFLAFLFSFAFVSGILVISIIDESFISTIYTSVIMALVLILIIIFVNEALKNENPKQ